MDLQTLSWITAGISIAGTLLNIYKNPFCFILWILTNFSWFWIDLKAGLNAQAALFAVYTGLAIYGFIQWRFKGKQ